MNVCPLRPISSFCPELGTSRPPLTDHSGYSADHRCRLLTELHVDVQEEELTAETLLKAFDISLHDLPTCDTLQASGFLSESGKQTKDRAGTNESPANHPHSQNPFLSTPLRLKHFPRLSPTILRVLLRSPSLPSSSFCGDDSFEVPYSVDSTPDLDEPFPLGSPLFGLRTTSNSAEERCSCAEESAVTTRACSLPLTPPPSGHIPFSSQLPDPAFHNSTERIFDHGHHPAGVARNYTMAGPFLDSVSHVMDNFPSNSLVSPAAVINFRRVIDELKGLDSGDQGVNSAFECKHDDNSPPLPSSLPNPVAGFPIPQADLRCSSKVHDSLAMGRTLGALEDEFIRLLERRATEAEAGAEELRGLANRLENMAKGRRHLVTLILEMGN
ncbi:hypothetical protein B0H10DRAFT_29712 [Mycena sp. CBHHK59/15]|nr:hypothetical protein B0H10DRAFT_29712 [Mycena sp. CBHHK59/15]